MSGLCLLLSLCCAEPKPDPTPKTVVYEVADLLHRPGGWTGFDALDEISQAIVEATGPKNWDIERKNAWTLRELDGKRLEITAPARTQEEVRDLLAALRRINDVAVTLDASLIEVDRAYYERVLKPLIAAGRRGLDGPAAVDASEELLEAVRKKGVVVRTTRTTLAIGREETYLSVRQVVSYVRKPEVPAEKLPVEYGTVGVGVRLSATAVVSPDRRFVRLKLREQAVDLLRFEKQPYFKDRGREEIIVPELAETSTTLSLTVGDGADLLVTVQHLPKATRAKDRVLVLLFQPRIFILEEEKAKGNNPK